MNAATSEHLENRVRRHTAPAACERIDAKTRQNIRHHASHPAGMDRRIAELEHEWDVERTLEANASTLALTGAVLGTTVNKKWFWLTGGVLGFLFQHATSGWCPPLPLLRKLGFRTRSEIDREKFALKAIRGDFGRGLRGDGDIASTLHAVCASEAAKSGREPDRVRRYTATEQQRKLDAAMEKRIRLYASQPVEVISERIVELTREWSIERYLQINVAVVGLTAVALAVSKNRNWGYVACAGLAFFLFHAVEGFDPPLPLLRKAGVRTRAEINSEIYALKILRGDFDAVIRAETAHRKIDSAIEAVGA